MTTALDPISSNGQQSQNLSSSNGFKPTHAEEIHSRSIYEASSQYRHWRFSAERLKNIRETLNQAAVAVIRSAFENDEVILLSYHLRQPGSSQAISFLTASEEYSLVKHYITKVTQLCGHFRFSEEVEATAVSYLKRFYLKNTVMDWHPKNVMLTALFLALKTTNNAISLDEFTSHIPKTSPADVLDLEFLVAQSLAFEFAVWHAHRALWGFRLDTQELPDAPVSELDPIFETAATFIRASRLTDAELIYTPSQIALAALWSAAPQLALAWASSKGQSESLTQVLSNIKAIVDSEGVGLEVETVRVIDKRLRICKNPEKVKGSKAWLKKQQEAEEKAKIKRIKKAEDARKAMEDDPFGGELLAESQEKPATVIDEDDDD
ncbi:hypothetical protein Clacol_008422 [Clathrus columnatus]|uniref:Cyclin-like domain-containing protein n=1 Tax=Clathrus columnatus TaxID=1419009 RepID=A0AAV5AHP0_9AGAM|nr:hypothetical protein Clacol_008422 [Clathrus columnatus]